jgi:hypothetical protein
VNKNQRGDQGRRLRQVVGFAAVAIYVLILATAASAANGFEITIPVETVVRAPEGSITDFEPVIQVPEEYQGQECSVVAHAQNQGSVHPGNDLLVTSGSSQVVIPDVEAEPGGSVQGEGTLVLGSTIVVSLRMGPDEVFSAGFDVVVDCQPDETTTTTIEVTTTTTPATTTTTAEGTTTTVPAITSTTIPDQVLALVFVTVEGECVVDDGKGHGEITVTVSIDDAATVIIRDSDGNVEATVTSDAEVTVAEDDTYTWEATPAEGFEFADDFAASGEVEIEACTKDEVKDLEVLPFTGIDTEGVAVIAAVLSAIGLLVILATRRVED